MPHKVYWSEEGFPKSQDFSDGQWTEIMAFMEELRKKANVSFVSLSSEVPGDVTKKGVDVTGPDYDWKKRRP